MSIPVPDLDDRDFHQLVAEALAHVRRVDPSWTDLSVHDPGVVLLEGFAHLTDVLLYRLNRVPERLYAVFLGLLGAKVGAPAAAQVTLRFTRSGGTEPLTIPAGTRVSVANAAATGPLTAPVFITVDPGQLPPGPGSVDLLAVNAVAHDAVLIGTGTGGPSQTCVLPGAPALAGPVVVGVQVAQPRGSGAEVLIDGRAFRPCREVEVFADARPDEYVCRIDRVAGLITFPWFAQEPDPTASAARPPVPASGMQIRAWYRSGGGVSGNVPADSLTVIRDAVAPGGGGKLTVSNPAAATGGRDAEPVEQAARRAPQEFQGRDRAVTAADYEAIAVRHGAVARAHASTRRDLWAFATPGEVEVALVPQASGQAPASHGADHDRILTEVRTLLVERATIGAVPVVRWAGDKSVRVLATVVARPDENVTALRERIVSRLNAIITPLPAPALRSADFGRPLRVSNLYRAIEEHEPGVRYVKRLTVELAQVPDRDASELVSAPAQPGCWFVAQGPTLFRTVNGAAGWETCFTGSAEVRAIRPWPAVGQSPQTAGLLAVAVHGPQGSQVLVSPDLGHTWREVARFAFGVNSLAWLARDQVPLLLAASERGLYELALHDGAVPVQNVVDPAQPELGLYDVVTMTDVRGQVAVAVAAEGSGGVWLSTQAGANATFTRIRRAGEDIRSLTVHSDGASRVLFAARSVPDGEGTGCAVAIFDEFGRLDPATVSWRELTTGWTGGSCSQVVPHRGQVYAATQSGGILRLDAAFPDAAWRAADVNCGLPLRDRRRFAPLSGIGIEPGGPDTDGFTLLAAGPAGVWRSSDGGERWVSASARVVNDTVTIPAGWLFSSGDHQIEVVTGDG